MRNDNNSIERMPRKDMWYLVVIGALSILMQLLPYNKLIGLALQIAVVVGTVVLYQNTPIVSVAAVLLLNVVPSLLFYATHDVYLSFYQLNDMMIVLMCIAFLGIKLVAREWKLQTNMIATLLFFFGLYLLATMFTAEHTVYYNMGFFVMPIMYMSLPFFFEKREDVYFAKWAFGVAGFIYAFFMVKSVVTDGTIYDNQVLIDRNYLAMFVLIAIMMIANLLFDGKRKHVLFSIVAMTTIAALVYLLFTYASRSAFILLIAYAVMLTTYVMGKNIRAMIPILILIVLGGWIVLNTDAATFLFERLNDETASSGNGRIDLIYGYINGFIDAPLMNKLLGYGYKVFRAEFQNAMLYAHNSFLACLLDFGIIGVLFYFAMLIRSWRGLVKSQDKLLLISLIVISVNMLTLEVHQDMAGICYLMTCIGAADVNA